MTMNVVSFTAMPVKLKSEIFLWALPFVLLLSASGIFISASACFGKETGYLLGFSFYYLVWCLGIPLLLIGPKPLFGLLKPIHSIFAKENRLALILLITISLTSFFVYFLPSFFNTSWLLIFIAIPIATINGFCEEILWRGLYYQLCPQDSVRGYLYPAFGFAIWHIAPQLIFPAEGGMFTLILAAFVLGLCYGWITRKTGNVFWVAISHSLSGVFAFGGALAPSIYSLLG